MEQIGAILGLGIASFSTTASFHCVFRISRHSSYHPLFLDVLTYFWFPVVTANKAIPAKFALHHAKHGDVCPFLRP